MKKDQPYPYAKKFTSAFLQSLADAFDRPTIGYAYNVGGYTPWPKVSRAYYRKAIARMKKQGWIEEAEQQGKKFFKLTKKGRVSAFMRKLGSIERPRRQSWRGGWWLALFDIPEEKGRRERHQIRRALLYAGFTCLQKSVYLYPYDLPKDLVGYLKVSGLDRFVRLLHVDRADDSRDLKRRCKL